MDVIEEEKDMMEDPGTHNKTGFMKGHTNNQTETQVARNPFPETIMDTVKDLISNVEGSEDPFYGDVPNVIRI